MPGDGGGRVVLALAVFAVVMAAGGGVTAAGDAPADAVLPTAESPEWAGEADTATADDQSAEQVRLTTTNKSTTASEAPDAVDDRLHMDRSVQQQRGTRTIELERTYSRLTNRHGEIGVEHRYRVPDGVTRLELRLPDTTTVQRTTGFVREGDQLIWDRSTEQPRVSYRYDANRTMDHDGPIDGPGRFIFVDVGDWALTAHPNAGHSWGWTGGGQVGFETSDTVEGPGATSDRMVFLGEHRTRTHTAHGQTFELVIPAAASLAESPGDIFESLEQASDTIRVGDRDARVFAVAAPTDQIEWGARGLQTGPADMWVRDIERLDTPDNVWLHEYVHTRQDYQTEPATRWFTEATATYYAALLTLEAGDIDFEQFQQQLARGGNERFDGSVLSRPGTWEQGADYIVGALTTGELDRQIRVASDGERSFQNVFRALNEEPDAVSAQTLRSFIERAGSQAVGQESDRLLTTTQRTQMWDRDAHVDAFGVDPARIEYRLAAPDDPDAYRVDGAFRTRSLDGQQPIRLVTGERLTVGASARNAGGVEGSYEARFRIDGQIRDRRTGRLAPDETTTFEFDHQFDEPGERLLAVGDDSVTVSVTEPTTPRITSVETNRSRLSPGESVRISVELRNEADRPAELELPIFRNGEQIDNRTVRLDVDEQRTVRFTDSPTETGRVRYTFGETTSSAVTVRVQDGSIPGFNVGAGLVGVLLAVLLFRRRA